jgi:GcrA cell cycle regulator
MTYPAGPARPTPWTDHRVELLKTLWDANELSCSEIAYELGGGISRNAVIGKALRMGLSKKGRAPATRGAKLRRTKIKGERPATEKKTIRKSGKGFVPLRPADFTEADDVTSVQDLEAQTPPDTFLGIHLVNLNPNQCRYPRTIDGATLFCGQPKLEESSYCASCHQRCHSRASYRLNISEEERGRRRALAAKMNNARRAA